MTLPKPIDPPATDNHLADLPHRRRWIDDLIEIDQAGGLDDAAAATMNLQQIQANGQHTLAALMRLEAALLRLGAGKR